VIVFIVTTQKVHHMSAASLFAPEAPLKVQLSSAGLSNIQNNLYENDFTFIVQNECYHCPSFIAEFLSPHISRLRSNDPTLQQYEIDASDPTHEFSSLLALGHGTPLTITKSNQALLEKFCGCLRNRELYNSIVHAFESELSCENVISRLNFLSETECDFSEELEFASSHFWELLKLDLSSLNAALIDQIVTDPLLRLADEDSLWHFLFHSSLFTACPSLLYSVKYEYLSTESMTEFVDFVASSVDFLTPGLWEAIRGRLLGFDSPTPRFVGPSHPFRQDQPFSGIIAALTHIHRANVHECGVLKLTSSSAHSAAPFAPISNLVELTTRNHYASDNISDSWICWDFVNLRVTPTHYAIRSDAWRADLRSWVLEGSNDGASWTLLDDRPNDEALKGQGSWAVGSWAVARPAKVRMVRIRATGRNHRGDDHVSFSAVEFFGNLDNDGS
jgi:hypothetical protein